VKKITYLDNAATSWPKPESMAAAMAEFNRSVGANPGRSGHTLSIEAARTVMDAREALADLFGVSDMLRIVFTKNATEALNIVISGLLKPGDHAITTSMEHNSVMRPLRFAATNGVSLSIAPCTETGELDPQAIADLITPDTRAIFMTHASNVTGTIMPVAEVGAIARERGVLLCVDASQTAGALPISVSDMHIDFLAFTGHKALLGPQGTGGLYMRKGLEEFIPSPMLGGTGSRSEFEVQPDFMPDKYEAGTPNTIGLAGLHAGARFIMDTGIGTIRQKEMALTARLIEGLDSISGVRIFGTRDASKQTAVVSLTVAGINPSQLSMMLDEQYGIMSRPGLHCAPAAHRTIRTFPEGTVRLSPGFFTTAEDIEYAVRAIARIAKKENGVGSS